MRMHALLVVGMTMVAVGFTACTSLPHSSRTSTIHDIKMELELSPERLSVAAGDEVRWMNLRKNSVLVQIPNLHTEDLTCQSGFKNSMGQLRESVRVKPNGTVSLCFKKSGVVLYNVRAQTAIGGGERVFSGSVTVGNVPDTSLSRILP
jgi:plastocyanin